MRALIIRNRALDDIEKICRWYELERNGLGTEFIKEWERVIEHLNTFPHSGRVFRSNIRQLSFLQFPFYLMYQVEDSRIIVHSVVHTSRHPSKRNPKQ